MTSSIVTGSGTTSITINPTGTFAEQTGYYVQIDATAFDDATGNSYAGIADATTWNFTTGDFSNPVLSNGLPIGALPAGTTQTTISLDTSENATCRYASTILTPYLSMADTFDTTGETSHSQTITGLADSTIYVIYVRCQDNLGNANADDYPISFFVASPPPPAAVVSGGGGLPLGAYGSVFSAPAGGFGLVLNNGDQYTANPIVTLNLTGGVDAARMAISNSPDFSLASQETFIPTKYWDLCPGQASCSLGQHTIYVKFYNQYSVSSRVLSASIIYRQNIPIVEIIKEIPKKIVEEIKVIPKIVSAIPQQAGELTKKIIEILNPSQPPVSPAVLLEQLVPNVAPMALSGQWTLLSQESINSFALSPLLQAVEKLMAQFPELIQTLKQVGVTKITDISKLQNISLTLPGLTQRASMPGAVIAPGMMPNLGQLVLLIGLPLAELSPEIKQGIPTETIFAKTSGEKIDFNITLTINQKGEPEQKIFTIAGKPLQLVVKPGQPVNSVTGYLVFQSRAISSDSLGMFTPVQKFNFLTDLVAALIFADPVYAQTQEIPVGLEERLVLQQFDYADLDSDGIYTAQIQMPVASGQYEVITILNFTDPQLSAKEIKLTTVVDPEGYVYEKNGDRETRVPGAIISLYWLNPQTKQYELWSAKDFQQENPQVTDVRGTYSFLVPPGYYYLKTEAFGYDAYDGKPFSVKEGLGVHINIELKAHYWWLKIFDWKTIVLIMVVILLFYNFYRDKTRGKLTKNKIINKNNKF